MLHIKSLWDQVRGKISDEIESPDNIYGCLDGALDEYMQDFEPTMDQLLNKLAQRQDVLQKEVDSLDP